MCGIYKYIHILKISKSIYKYAYAVILIQTEIRNKTRH